MFGDLVIFRVFVMRKFEFYKKDLNGRKGKGCVKNGFFSVENYYWIVKYYIVK